MAFANFVAMAVTTSMYEKADESAEVVVQMMLVSGVDALKIAVIIANGDVANNVSSDICSIRWPTGTQFDKTVNASDADDHNNFEVF